MRLRTRVKLWFMMNTVLRPYKKDIQRKSKELVNEVIRKGLL